MHVPKKNITQKKYLAIQARYKHLYDVKRLRYDDVIKQIQEEYFYASHHHCYDKKQVLLKERLQSEE